MRGSLLAAVVLLWPQVSLAGVPLVELRTATKSYRGRVVAQGPSKALLVDRDGVMRDVPLANVTSYGIVDKEFRPYQANDLRRLLKDVAGSSQELDMVATKHFVVAGRPNAARAASLALEEVHDQYRYFCSTHNLPLNEPEFPLVAIVLPDAHSFGQYCIADGVMPSRSLAGYYRETTNRFVCYEMGATRDDPIAGVRETLTHEAVHQLAFNTGLHVRMGNPPAWVVEGLATTLEPEGVRRPFDNKRLLDRVNPERFYRITRMIGKKGTAPIEDIVETDNPFERSPLESYAKAWAMTFYMLETRPSDYLRYLRRIAAHSPLDEYTASERVADFKWAFGSDFGRLETNMADFMRRVAAGGRR